MKTQNQLPLHSKMLNSSHCCEGSVLTDQPIVSEIWQQLNGQNCWESCGGGGLCEDFCGPKGYCCRKGWNQCPLLAENESPEDYHSCVKLGVNHELVGNLTIYIYM